MAVNEKPVYATGYTTHGGKLFAPGERLDNRGLPEHAVRGALEGGVASDVARDGEQARKAEAERRASVERQITERSEKRDHDQRANIPQLVRLPDGSLAQVDA